MIFRASVHEEILFCHFSPIMIAFFNLDVDNVTGGYIMMSRLGIAFTLEMFDLVLMVLIKFCHWSLKYLRIIINFCDLWFCIRRDCYK